MKKWSIRSKEFTTCSGRTKSSCGKFSSTRRTLKRPSTFLFFFFTSQLCEVFLRVCVFFLLHLAWPQVHRMKTIQIHKTSKKNVSLASLLVWV
jgi:hypothetical protein